jgi:predicted amidohydrolase
VARILRTACTQLGPINLADDRKSVVARLVALLREAHGMGAKLVVFPELALTTFFPRYWYEDQAKIDAFFEPAMPGPETQPLFDEAAKLGIGFHIGYGELEAEGGTIRRFNTAILVGPDGKLIGKYRKIHLPGHVEHKPDAAFQHLEKRYFEPGNLGFQVWRAYDGVLGMCICNDRRWVETYRVMGLQGVEMIALGYNTPSMTVPSDGVAHQQEPSHLRMFHHLLSLQAGAYQNATWVVASGKAGDEDGHNLIGGSAIVAPTGEIAARTMTEEDEVIVFDCDFDLCTFYKERVFNFARHRRPEHYGRITSQVGAEPPPE